MNPEEVTPPPVVVPPDALPPQSGAYASRVKIVGICFATLAAYSLVMLLYFFFLAGSAGMAGTHNGPPPPGSRAAEHDTAQIAGAMVLFGALANLTAILGLGLSLVAAIGLLGRHRWGRVATIVVSIPLLIIFPLGTILAIFALYMMLKSGSKENYELLCASKAY